MKNLSLLTKATLAILCVAGLGACGKKKGNNAVAAAPAGYTTCTTGVNPYTNQPCQIGTLIYPTGGTTTCTTGINPYTNQACVIGTPIYQTGGTTTCTTGINPYTNQPCVIGTPIYGQQPGYTYPGQQNCQTMYGPQYDPTPRYMYGGLYCFPYGYNNGYYY